MNSGDPRRWALVGIVLITCLVAMEGTVVSTAMPRTVAELGDAEHIAWVFSAFLSALAITGPVWGNLADRWGARPVYIACVTIFLAGSCWAATAHSMRELVMARVVQGLGGGGLTPLGQMVLSLLYEKRERANAQAWLVGAWGVASVVGPPLGGWLTQHGGWRWVFLLPIPFGLLGALMILLFLRPSELVPKKAPFDWGGVALFVAWMILTLRATEHPEPAVVAGVGVLGMILLIYSKGRKHPFLPLSLVRFKVFRGTLLLAPLIGAAVFGAVNFFPLFLQRQFGLDDMGAGRAMLPLSLGWVFCSGLSARLALRFGPGRVVGLSVLGLSAGYAALASQHSVGGVGVGEIGLAMAGGLSFTPLTLSVQDEVPREQLGQATSAIVFLRTLGSSLGTAVLGSVLHNFGFAWMFRTGLILAVCALVAWLPYRRAVSS